MKNIAIIPARAGSKGLPDKNIRPLNGVPLMAYTIKAALDSGMFDRVMVSTDSEEYARIARQWGAEVPFLRSAETSHDRASSWSVVREVLDRYEEMGEHFDCIGLLQVTSPLRQGRHIVEAFELMEKHNANSVMSMCETECPIAMCYPLPEDGFLEKNTDDRNYRPRQILGTTYHPNGAIYLWKTESFSEKKSIMEVGCYAYVMEHIYSNDVDSIEDFMLNEALVRYLPEFKNYFD